MLISQIFDHIGVSLLKRFLVETCIETYKPDFTFWCKSSCRTKMLFGHPQLPSQKPPKTNHKCTYTTAKPVNHLNPTGDELSRRIRAFVIVKEDNLKTMPGRSVSSRGSVGWKTKGQVLTLQTNHFNKVLSRIFRLQTVSIYTFKIRKCSLLTVERSAVRLNLFAA